MKTLKLYAFLVWFAVFNFPIFSAIADSTEVWEKRFEDATSSEILKMVAESGDQWPPLKFTEKSELSADDALAVTVLEALKEKSESIFRERSSATLTELAQTTANVAVVTSESEGYFNDLISASAENIVILCSWHVLSADRSSWKEIQQRAVAKLRGEIWAKAWFDERLELDPWLMGNKDRFVKLKDDTGGFQAGNYLGMGRDYPKNKRPNVFEMVKNPDLVTLWWEVFLNNFELDAVLPATLDYISKGGILTPVPPNMPDAVDEVFEGSGLPYKHQLREGQIDAEDIWRSLDLSIDEDKMRVNVEAWFGNR